MKIERPRGTRDFLPDEIRKRRAIETVMRKIAESYGYGEIATPVFEHLELFTTKSGEGIVKEIYAFRDKSGRELALRPELTAPVMRLFVNECSVMPRPLRFYYFANCFRYERPQKGRYREFWQFGVELIGSSSHLADAEVISLAYRILNELGLDFELHIGHVGVLRYLLRHLEEEKAAKIMRLIDKRDTDGLTVYLDEIGAPHELADRVFSLIDLSGGREVLGDASKIVKFDTTYMEKLCDVLDSLEINYTINLGTVRGLDYYTGVVFEAYAKHGLGAEKQICGGGSYRLAHLFGGEDIQSTGFALGFDRIAEICDLTTPEKPLVAVASIGFEKEACKLADSLRRHGICAVTDVMERSLKRQLSFANDVNARFAVIVGKREIESGKYTLKDMETGESMQLEFEELLDYFRSSGLCP